MSENTAVAVREPTALERIKDSLDKRVDEIARLLPPGMDARRFTTVSLLAITKNPKLLECDRTSLVLSIIEAAEIGLEPTGGVGGAHLVPFGVKGGGKKAQLIYDYRGVQHLIRVGGGGEVKTVLVYEGDEFEVYEGTDPKIVHKPKYATTDPTKITHVYAWPLDHPDKFEVMTKEQVDKVRARSRAANDGPWVTDYGPQARKTVLKRISAWLPLKPEVRARLETDTERELGTIETPTETVKSRTAEVREKIRGKSGTRRQRPKDAPGAADKAKTPNDAATTESAQQQPESDTTADEKTVDGTAVEVCGEGSDPKLGDVETCVLEPGHLASGMKLHKGASGSVWPAAKT